MELHEAIKPTPEMIKEVKQAYNRVLERNNRAMTYLDSPDVPLDDKGKHIAIFKIEIIDVLSAYIKLLKNCGVEVTDDEILGGMKIE